MLERMGFEVELHNSYFVHDELDDKWIPEVAGRKWAILTGDKRISVDPVNRAAVMSSKAQVIIVSDTNSLPEQWAASIIVGRLRLLELLDKHSGPVFIKVGRYAKDHVTIKDERNNKSNEDQGKQESSADVAHDVIEEGEAGDGGKSAGTDASQVLKKDGVEKSNNSGKIEGPNGLQGV